MGSPKRRNNRSTARVRAAVPVAAGAYSEVGDTLSPAAQARAAIRSLSVVAPLLHETPDLLREARHIVEQASARYEAYATGNAFTGIGVPIAVDLFTRAGGPSSPTGSTPQASSPAGYLGGWAGAKDAPKGVLNAKTLRQFANDPWVFAAKKHLADRIARADVDVLPLDYDKPYDKAVQHAVKRLLNCPNEYRDSWTSLIKRTVDDILTIDRGVFSKAMSARRLPMGLYSEDGATIKIFANWDGNPKTPRYLYEEPGSARKVPLRNDECIVIMEAETTYRYGYSRVQALINDIEADVQASMKGADFVLNKPAQHAIQVPGAGEYALRQLRTEYDNLIGGKREIMFLGGDQPMHAMPLVFSLKDNQWMEWQTYLARKIGVIIGVSPQTLGFIQDVNRSTAESQQDIEADTALIPLLQLIEEYLNRELLWDYAPLSASDGRPDFERLNLGIFFPEISEASRIMHIQRLVDTAETGLAKGPFMTPNDVRAMFGEEPMPGGNTLYYPSPSLGMVPWLSYDGEVGAFSSYAEGGELGAQEPGGGPGDDERDLDDTTQSKPAQQQTPTVSDDSSGNGAPPNIGSDGDSGAGAGAGGAGAGAAAAGKGYVPRPYRRLPGRSWHPPVREDAPQQQHQRQQAPLPQRAAFSGAGAGMGAMAWRSADPTEQLVGMVASAVGQVLTQLGFGNTNHPHHAARRSANAALGGPPRSLGRVSDDVAIAHHRPHEEVVARANVASAVATVFERAERKGSQALIAASTGAGQTAAK